MTDNTEGGSNETEESDKDWEVSTQKTKSLLVISVQEAKWADSAKGVKGKIGISLIIRLM